MKELFFILTFLFSIGNLSAQESACSDNLHISGVIQDAEGEFTIPYANIVYLPNLIGTISDFDGNFEFRIPKSQLDKKSMLEISYVGFKTVVYKLKDFRKSDNVYLNVKMNPSERDKMAVSEQRYDGAIYLHHTFRNNPIKVYKDPILR